MIKRVLVIFIVVNLVLTGFIYSNYQQNLFDHSLVSLEMLPQLDNISHYRVD